MGRESIIGSASACTDSRGSELQLEAQVEITNAPPVVKKVVNVHGLEIQAQSVSKKPSAAETHRQAEAQIAADIRYSDSQEQAPSLQNDIANMYSHFGACEKAGLYQDCVQNDAAGKAITRWPLIAELESLRPDDRR